VSHVFFKVLYFGEDIFVGVLSIPYVIYLRAQFLGFK